MRTLRDILGETSAVIVVGANVERVRVEVLSKGQETRRRRARPRFTPTSAANVETRIDEAFGPAWRRDDDLALAAERCVLKRAALRANGSVRAMAEILGCNRARVRARLEALDLLRYVRRVRDAYLAASPWVRRVRCVEYRRTMGVPIKRGPYGCFGRVCPVHGDRRVSHVETDHGASAASCTSAPS